MKRRRCRCTQRSGAPGGTKKGCRDRCLSDSYGDSESPHALRGLNLALAGFDESNLFFTWCVVGIMGKAW
eukprot:4226772-Alexandrium_andersonii.AAC.1